MDTTVAPQPSLLEEFQSLHKLIKDDEVLICHGKNRKGNRCGRRSGKAVKRKLLALALEVIECLKNGRDGIELLLEKASSFAMCLYHQSDAMDKCKTWMDMVPLTTNNSSLDDADAKVSISKLKHIATYPRLANSPSFNCFVV